MTSQTTQRAPPGARASFRAPALLLAGVIIVSSGTAGAASGLEQDVRACAALADSTARLACFDALAERLDSPETRADQTGSGVLATPAPDARPTTDDAPRSEPEPEPEPTIVRAVIERLQEQPRGERIFHLSNGQIWVELEPGRSRYREGMSVTVERTTLGSYMLSTGAGRATRVRRLQ